MSALTQPEDPANANEDHTRTDGLKPDTFTSAILDPDFRPTLEQAPVLRHVQSYLVLAGLLAAGLGGAWWMGLEVLQSPVALVGSAVAIGFGIAMTGGLWIDWWELVLVHWWFSFPIAGLAGVIFLMMQESAQALEEVD